MSLNRRSFLVTTAALTGSTALTTLFGSSPGDAAPAADISAKLKVYNWGNAQEAKVYEDAFARFRTAYPNVSVQNNIVPITSWSDYADKLVTEVAAGNAPDVINIAIEGVRLAASKGLLRPLNDLIASDPELAALVAKVPEALKAGLTIDGQLQVVPAGVQSMVIHYNTKLFKEAGLEPPKADWTWDDFLATAKALTKGEGGDRVFGFGIPWFNFGMHPWYLTNGTYPVTDDYAHSNLNNPKMIEAVQFIYDLVHTHKVSPDPIGLSVYDQFAAGKLGMVGAGRWPVSGWVANGFTDFDINFWPRKETATTVFGPSGLGISPKSGNPELALQAIKAVVSVKTIEDMVRIGQQVPVYEEITQEDFYKANPPHAKIFYDALKTARAVAAPKYFSSIDRILGRTLDQIITNAVSVADGMKQGHDELETAIADF